jgi:carbonic anhydrase
MSTTDEPLKANEHYAQSFQLGHLLRPPARKVAVLACMDARLAVEQVLGLETGDAHIIRNAGGIATEMPCAPCSSPIICWGRRSSSSSTTPAVAC